MGKSKYEIFQEVLRDLEIELDLDPVDLELTSKLYWLAEQKIIED